MRMRGLNSDERAVQTDPMLRYASGTTEKKKCRELLAQKLANNVGSCCVRFARSLKNLVFPIMYLWMSCNIEILLLHTSSLINRLNPKWK